VWESLTTVVEQKERWRRAYAWLESVGQREQVNAAKELIERTPWGARIWILCPIEDWMLVGFLAVLLSTEWLAERHLNAYAAYLNPHARAANNGIWVTDVYLSIVFKAVHKKGVKAVRESFNLAKFHREIVEGGYKTLFILANLDSIHWIVFRVDLQRKEIGYGTSR
jgi:hypothetical protein